MGTPPGRYPGGEPPQYGGEPDPASVPATQDDIQTLRRWLAVAAIWAAAASAIALIALLDDDTGGGSGRTSGSLSKVEKRLNDRIDSLEDDVQEANSGGDTSQLEDRIDELQGDVDELKQQQDTVEGLQGDITTFEDKLRDLENRISQLESSQNGSGGASPEP